MDLTCLFNLLPEGIKYLCLNHTSIARNLRIVMRRFFYKESIIDDLLYYFKGNRLKDDEFIDYKAVFDGNIYPALGMEVKLQKSRIRIKTFTLPYVECINFIENPNAELRLLNTGDIPQIYPDSHVCGETKGNLAAYLKKKTDTYNEPILCMKRLKEVDSCRFTCEVGWTYFTEVARTNLTLDYPLEGRFRETLRHRETALAGGGLPSFEESKLMNCIGVSAVWCMDKGHGAPSDRYYYYLKCRKKQISVYYNMMGTPSGYVNPPKPKRLDDPDMMKFLREEILREFDEETGYEAYATSKGFAIRNEDGPVKVIPLALTRELARGGMPQLFFLILTPYITDNEFVNYFKGSRDGKKEFRDSTAANRWSHPLSPEVFTNLIYAYKWMQRDYNNGEFIKV